jgi:hypothetical protein
MLLLSVFGFFCGVIFGDLVIIKLWHYQVARLLVLFGFPVISFFFIWKKGRLPSASVCVVTAFLWGLIHNPSLLIPALSPGRVIWSGGCGLQDDDLLVAVEGNVYRGKGRAFPDDWVWFDGKRLVKVHAQQIMGVEPEITHPLGCLLGKHLRTAIHSRLRYLASDVSLWLRAFLLGEQVQMAPGILESFRDLGLLHLLVLSGSHLSVVACLIRLCLQLPWHVPYVFGRLSPIVWAQVFLASRLATSLVLFVYCAAAGFSQSLQRALLCFVSNMVPSFFGIPLGAQSRILLAIIFQATIFPTNFLSLSMLMSWCGVLLLTAFVESAFLKSYWRVFVDGVLVQSVFFIFSLIFFGQVGVTAIPVNMLFHPVFSLLLPFDLVALTLPFEWVDDVVVFVNRQVLSGIKILAEIQQQLPVTHIQLPVEVTVSHFLGRLLVAALIIAMFVLSGWRQPDNEKN